MVTPDDRLTLQGAIRRWQPQYAALRRTLDSVASDEDFGDAAEVIQIRRAEREAWDFVETALRGPDERGLMRSPDPVTIELPRSAALILDAWLNDQQSDDFSRVTSDPPTQFALNQALNALEPVLAESFRPDYHELLDEARQEVTQELGGWSEPAG